MLRLLVHACMALVLMAHILGCSGSPFAPLSDEAAAALDKRCPGVVRDGEGRLLSTARCIIDVRGQAMPWRQGLIERAAGGQTDSSALSSPMIPRGWFGGPLSQPGDYAHGGPCKGGDCDNYTARGFAGKGRNAASATRTECYDCGKVEAVVRDSQGNTVYHEQHIHDPKGTLWMRATAPPPREGSNAARALDRAEDTNIHQLNDVMRRRGQH